MTKTGTQNPVSGAGVDISWSFDPNYNDGSIITLFPGDSPERVGVVTIEAIEESIAGGGSGVDIPAQDD